MLFLSSHFSSPTLANGQWTFNSLDTIHRNVEENNRADAYRVVTHKRKSEAPPSVNGDSSSEMRSKRRFSSSADVQIDDINISNGIKDLEIDASSLNGLFAVNKPTGMTSFDVVRKIKNILEPSLNKPKKGRRKPQIKIGHGGTLVTSSLYVLVNFRIPELLVS